MHSEIRLSEQVVDMILITMYEKERFRVSGANDQSFDDDPWMNVSS